MNKKNLMGIGGLLLGMAMGLHSREVDFPKLTGPYLGQKPPGITPERFAQEIILDHFYPHSKLIISPDGKRIYWTTFLNLESSETVLYYSDFDGKNLSAPTKETTLTESGILHFVFTKDGNKVLFGSLRPYDKMNGKSVHAVWVCEKRGPDWSTPQPIECTVDPNWASLGSVSINGKGDIYFVGRQEGGTAKIYCSKYENGVYQKYELLPEIINTGITLDPFIDYQDRFLLFAASQRVGNIGIINIYISFKKHNGDWSEPLNLGKGISTPFMDRFPMVTSEGKYLFFVTSHGRHFPSERTHFYWVDAKIIEELRLKELK